MYEFFLQYRCKFVLPLLLLLLAQHSLAVATDDNLTTEQLAAVRKLEQRRIDAIEKVVGSVIAIYGEQRQGGGSGVIIDPSGIGLTNHHVIIGAGTKGWGGLADGQMYRWELIGTDPGGDVAIIQLKGKEVFPFTPLADSDLVEVGDWALAMGNPFLLTEDQIPTVTLGIVSGVKRYQPGAGLNQLVYGNCIQTDSSINPGNSGGPLFNLNGEVMGINGRGSFKERGRVNVGLGYAISSNQIKNFIPDLLATKLVEHGTLDASFEDRKGRVVCSNLFEDSRLYKQGVRPGDELLKFEGEEIRTANQFTNLICTLPEDWPASLLIRKKDGEELTFNTRLYGLPYAKPKRPEKSEKEDGQTPEQREQMRRAMEMIELLSAPPGTIRNDEVNGRYAQHIIAKWKSGSKLHEKSTTRLWTITDKILEDEKEVGTQRTWIASDGTFRVTSKLRGKEATFFWDGSELTRLDRKKEIRLSLVEMKLCQEAVQAIGVIAANRLNDLKFLGNVVLDGSDKAFSRNAYRLKFIDDNNDPFFIWLSMQNENSEEHIQLLKAGADKDCELENGGIVFSQWRSEEDLLVASRRTTVDGLAETIGLTYETVSVTSQGVDKASPWQEFDLTEQVGEDE